MEPERQSHCCSTGSKPAELLGGRARPDTHQHCPLTLPRTDPWQTLRGSECRVLFFERNGLRHRELALPAWAADPRVGDKITAVQWNAESDVLAVVVRAGRGSRLQLWHRSNYQWQMKREIIVGSSRSVVASKSSGSGNAEATGAGAGAGAGAGTQAGSSSTPASGGADAAAAEYISHLHWDAEERYRLWFSTSSSSSTSSGVPGSPAAAEVRSLEFTWDHAVSATADCTVAVVDGSTLCSVYTHNTLRASAHTAHTLTYFLPQLPCGLPPFKPLPCLHPWRTPHCSPCQHHAQACQPLRRRRCDCRLSTRTAARHRDPARGPACSAPRC